MITCSNVSRSFRSVKKEPGLKGALRALTSPIVTESHALTDITTHIASGAFIGLVGANGAGKTSLLKILSGLIPPSSGSVLVADENPFHRSKAFRKKIALVMGQKAQLWWDLPALDAFDLICAIYEIEHKEYKKRLALLTALLGVERHLHTQMRRLSLGERMKMELIGALLHWPDIIFLDEPTIGLDVLAAEQLRIFLADFHREKKATIILTSHNMDDIERLCERILILKDGALLLDSEKDTKIFLGKNSIRVLVRMREKPTLEHEIHADGRYIFSTSRDDLPSFISHLVSSSTITDLSIEEARLESLLTGIYKT